MRHLKAPLIWLLRLIVAGLVLELVTPHLAATGSEQILRAGMAVAALAILGALHFVPDPPGEAPAAPVTASRPARVSASPTAVRPVRPGMPELPDAAYLAREEPRHAQKPARYQFQDALDARLRAQEQAEVSAHRGRRSAAMGYLVLAIILGGLLCDPASGRISLEAGLIANLSRAGAGLAEVAGAIFSADWPAAIAWAEGEILALAGGDLRALWQLVPFASLAVLLPSLALTFLAGTGRPRKRQTSAFGEPLAWR
ncbi:hypothetical protein [Pseudoroseicyclus sp. CXY001]|uniref:hypothetical protein n=1 Tax=Pseudoroseicyclus sp. CXY001 TaxID=3242492 RepID=UPI00357148B6